MLSERGSPPYIILKNKLQMDLLYDAGSPKPELCDNLEGWDGEEVGGRFKREGTHVYLWLIHVDIWQKPTQYC